MMKSSFPALNHLAIAMFVLLLMQTGAFAQEHVHETLPALGQEWNEALEPLRAMPVQESGFVRSGLAYAEGYLQSISNRKTFDGREALPTLLYLMASQQATHGVEIIRIYHPKLVGLYQKKFISLHDVRDQTHIVALMKMYQADQEGLLKPLNEMEFKAQLLEEAEARFNIVPRPHEWLSPAALRRVAPEEMQAHDSKILAAWEALKEALRADDPSAGGRAAATLAAEVNAAAEEQGVPLPSLGLDVFYQKHQPFAKSAFFYFFAALAYGLALFQGWRRPARVGYALLILGLIEQIIGIVVRWMLSGRAPLSNMYESFVFAVAGVVLVALIFEVVQKSQLAGLGGAILGFIFMVLAHKAPIFNSQIRPLMPALQSSWLTYHVAVIMLSYSAFALSFFFSICYLMKDVRGGDAAEGKILRRLPSLQSLDLLTYKTVAVGFPLLTLGIIFGAVWAETAWGRPWGFDPKETWSAITWLVYAIYLHARLIAGWRGRKAAYLSLLGFGCVLFTYLGVNYLLPGLHSYV